MQKKEIPVLEEHLQSRYRHPENVLFSALELGEHPYTYVAHLMACYLGKRKET